MNKLYGMAHLFLFAAVFGIGMIFSHNELPFRSSLLFSFILACVFSLALHIMVDIKMRSK